MPIGAVEALDVGVLVRLAGLDVIERHIFISLRLATLRGERSPAKTGTTLAGVCPGNEYETWKE